MHIRYHIWEKQHFRVKNCSWVGRKAGGRKNRVGSGIVQVTGTKNPIRKAVTQQMKKNAV